eukprot:926073_1
MGAGLRGLPDVHRNHTVQGAHRIPNIPADFGGLSEIPAGFDPVAEDLVRKLLVRDPDARLGAGPGGFADLKAHAFFEGIPFSNLARTAVPDIPPPPTLHNPAEPPSDESDDSDFQPMHLSAP